MVKICVAFNLWELSRHVITWTISLRQQNSAWACQGLIICSYLQIVLSADGYNKIFEKNFEKTI